MSIRINKANHRGKITSCKKKLKLRHKHEVYNPRKRRMVKAITKLDAFNEEGNMMNVPLDFAIKHFGMKNPNEYNCCNINFKMNLRPKQRPVVEDALKILSKDKNNGLLLNLHTSFGKTVISAYLACKMRLPTMVVFTSSTLSDQWLDTFSKFTDSEVWVVGKKVPEQCNVILTMVLGIKKIPKEILSQIGLLIIDEAHTFCTEKRIGELLKVTPRKIIMCTATVERKDGMHKVIKLMSGKHKIVRKNPVKPNMYVYKTGLEVITKNWESALKYLGNNYKRNNALVKLIKNNPNHKFLILTWRILHKDNIVSILQKNHIDHDWLAGDKKTYIDSNVLVSTISKAGTGFDEKSFCKTFNGIPIDTVVMMSSTKSIPLCIQIAGRAMRSDNPNIVYFLDESRTLQDHFDNFVEAVDIKEYTFLDKSMKMISEN